jgi:ribosome-binding factor A
MVQRAGKGDRTRNEKSQRQLKVGEEIRHIISDILLKGSFYEPALDGVAVTISEVSISPDFSNARVYCMPLGGVDHDMSSQGSTPSPSKSSMNCRNA